VHVAAGYACAYTAGYFLQSLGAESWRWVLLSCAVPSTITLLARLGTPESPSWLVSAGRTGEALSLVHRHVGEGYGVAAETVSLATTGFLSLFHRDMIRNTLIGGLFYACLVIPYFAISIFLPQIFTALGVKDSYLYGIPFNIFLIVGVVAGTYVVNRVRRRTFLLGCFYSCAAFLAVMALAPGLPVTATMALLFAFSFMISASAVLCYAYPAELFPSELRASGIGFSVACSRLGAAAATFLLPIVLADYGSTAALLGCIGALLFGGLICHLFAPETSNN